VITWTIGASGLLGSAIVRHAEATFTPSQSVPWSEPERAAAVLSESAREFSAYVRDRQWAVMWAAGAATTSSTPDQTSTELWVFEQACAAIAAHQPRGTGVVFVSSSVGGVYAGSSPAPFTSASIPAPLSAYGELKVYQEQAAQRLLADHCAVVLGRFTNIYGPGQDLRKLQGLISRLALSAVARQPINIFVSLDTMRDYIFSDDAAELALHWARRALQHRTSVYTPIIGSGESTSLGQLLHLVQSVARTKIPVALGAHASASAQALDLRVLVDQDEGTAMLPKTMLPQGVKAVYLDILQRVQQAALAG